MWFADFLFVARNWAKDEQTRKGILVDQPMGFKSEKNQRVLRVKKNAE